LTQTPKKQNRPHPGINIRYYIRGIEKSKTLVTGPKEVIDRFNSYCAAHDLSKWEGIELIMNIAAKLDEEMKLAGDSH